jgi:biopolymer transport protein TolR
MGMDVGGSKGGVMAKINIVPMIDILLVLLIIFMVITPLTPKGLEALIPQPPPKDQAPQSNERTVVIIINRDRSMMLNTEPITSDALGERLFQVFKTRAERVVFVKADPELEFQAVAEAIDIAKGAAIDKVGLMTEQAESGQ